MDYSTGTTVYRDLKLESWYPELVVVREEPKVEFYRGLRRFLVRLLAAFMFGTVLAGCGGGGQEPPDQDLYDLGIWVTPTNTGTVDRNPPGKPGPITATAKYTLYEPGTWVTLTPVPSTGWRFIEWRGEDAASIVGGKILMDADKFIGAAFDLCPPPAPTGLKIRNVAWLQDSIIVSLAWNASQNATSYNVYVGLSSDDLALKRSTNSTACECEFSILEDGRRYYFAVTALRQGRESGYSNMVSQIL